MGGTIYSVYIITDKPYGKLYIGVTNDLARRMGEHKLGKADSFSKRYGLDRLVYAEGFQNIYDAIAREKAMKKWNRRWKIELIERANPTWEELNPI